MKTIAIVRYGPPEKAFEHRDAPTPQPQPGQILIKVDAFGLNFAEVMARNGLYQEAPKPMTAPLVGTPTSLPRPSLGTSADSSPRR